MAGLAQLTQLGTLPQSMLSQVCAPIKAMAPEQMAVIKRCFPDLMKKTMEICKGGSKGDGKGDKHGTGVCVCVGGFWCL